jgi:hypothetical protein
MTNSVEGSLNAGFSLATILFKAEIFPRTGVVFVAVGVWCAFGCLVGWVVSAAPTPPPPSSSSLLLLVLW